MKAAAAAILFAAAVAPALGQQATVQYSWTWSEVLANSNTPSTATPGVIDSTEGVRLTLHALMTPDIGQAVNYFPPPIGPGVGTVYAWGTNLATIIGSSNAQGTFSHASVADGFLESSLTTLTSTTAQLGAISVWYDGGPSINFSNPINRLMSLTWTPASYSPRTVSFLSEDAPTTAPPNHMLVRYGTGPAGQPLVTSTIAFPTHGPGTGAIPIVPAPASLTLLAAAAFASRRRRAKQHTQHSST